MQEVFVMENSYEVPAEKNSEMLDIGVEELFKIHKEDLNRSQLGEELAALVNTDKDYARYKGYID